MLKLTCFPLKTKMLFKSNFFLKYENEINSLLTVTIVMFTDINNQFNGLIAGL